MRSSLVLTLVALLALAPAALAGGGRPTTVVTYQPFGASGLKQSIKVDETLTGSCFAGSSASPRRDAWRCSATNEIYDPCFSGASADAGYVVCPEFGLSPRSVDRIDLTSPLPSSGNTGDASSGKGLPWRLLARPYAGYCSLVTGTRGSYRGRKISYVCGLGGSLVGKPNRSSRAWTAKLLTEGDNPTLYTVTIRIAWY